MKDYLQFLVELIPWVGIVLVWIGRGRRSRERDAEIDRRMTEIRTDIEKDMTDLRGVISEHTISCNLVPKALILERLAALKVQVETGFAYIGERRLAVEHDIAEIRGKMHGDLKNVADAIRYMRGKE